jgi:hypothetical protein
MFEVDELLAQQASDRIASRRGIYWVIGGSCSGKTSVCSEIAANTDTSVYDMDENIYGRYRDRYSPSRHPASSAWFRRADALHWALSLSWEDFNNLNKATNAEFLDLFSQDILEMTSDRPLIVDGGITHPSLLAAVVDPQKIVCLEINDAESRRIWETDKARSTMRSAVKGLPDGRAAWGKFLMFNERISETINREAREQGIVVVRRAAGMSLEDLSSAVSQRLDI